MLHRLNGPLGLALVLLVTFAAYVPSLGNGYAMDDRLVAMGMNAGRKNAMIHELRSVAEYFRSHYWKGSVEEDRLYRPVTVWSYALVHRLARPSEPDPADTEQKQTAFPQHLLKAILANDLDRMEGLGIYEVVEEDLALCEFVCTSKQDVQEILREGIEYLKEQV